MDKRRILLIGPPNLLRDSLENILSNLDDVEMTGCLPLDDQALAGCAEQSPDLVLIADDPHTAHLASAVMSGLLEASPNLPIIRIKLEPNVLIYYCPEELPARVADLIKVIHQAPLAGV